MMVGHLAGARISSNACNVGSTCPKSFRWVNISPDASGNFLSVGKPRGKASTGFIDEGQGGWETIDFSQARSVSKPMIILYHRIFKGS